MTKYSRMDQVKDSLCGRQPLRNLKWSLNFLKAVFHKFYLVHFWILCLISLSANISHSKYLVELFPYYCNPNTTHVTGAFSFWRCWWWQWWWCTVMSTVQHGTELFSKKCDNWCHKVYTDKNEKQVGCYVNLDDVETFSDT